MEYRKKLFTVPVELATRLAKEKNQSGTVAEALTMYYAGKDGAKQLARLQVESIEAINGLDTDVAKVHRLLEKVVRFMNSQGADIAL